MNRKEFHSLLYRYINGQCSKEEADLVDQWYELLDDDGLPPIDEENMQAMEARIWNRLQPSKSTLSVAVPLYRKPLLKWSVAAAVLLIAGFSLWRSLNKDSAETLYTSLKLPEYEELINSQSKTISLNLEDGSQVLLDPGASLKYPRHFEPGTRKVYLKGSAFFQVAKNPERPFYVFSNHVITRVLGTSFYVSSYKKNKVEVSVNTGKVEVREGNTGLILTPNQKAIFNITEGKFEKALVDKPHLLQQNTGASAEQKAFVYEDAALEHVLADLSKAYGVEIIAENEILNQYPFTGDITGQDLYKQLDIICRVIKASYEIRGTTILINRDEKVQ